MIKDLKHIINIELIYGNSVKREKEVVIATL